MTKKKGLEYANQAPNINFNTILRDEKNFDWKKKCVTRFYHEWNLKERKPFSDKNRPSVDKDNGWERKCFDFFEPFYLTGLIDNLRGGDKEGTHGNKGSQIDIMFYLKAFDDEFQSVIQYQAICESKNFTDIDK